MTRQRIPTPVLVALAACALVAITATTLFATQGGGRDAVIPSCTAVDRDSIRVAQAYVSKASGLPVSQLPATGGVTAQVNVAVPDSNPIVVDMRCHPAGRWVVTEAQRRAW